MVTALNAKVYPGAMYADRSASKDVIFRLSGLA